MVPPFGFDCLKTGIGELSVQFVPIFQNGGSDSNFFFFVIFEFWILIGFEYQKFEFPNLNDFFFGIGIEVGSFHPILKRISQFWVSVLVFEQLRSGTVAVEADRSSHLQ